MPGISKTKVVTFIVKNKVFCTAAGLNVYLLPKQPLKINDYRKRVFTY